MRKSRLTVLVWDFDRHPGRLRKVGVGRYDRHAIRMTCSLPLVRSLSVAQTETVNVSVKSSLFHPFAAPLASSRASYQMTDVSIPFIGKQPSDFAVILARTHVAVHPGLGLALFLNISHFSIGTEVPFDFFMQLECLSDGKTASTRVPFKRATVQHVPEITHHWLLTLPGRHAQGRMVRHLTCSGYPSGLRSPHRVLLS